MSTAVHPGLVRVSLIIAPAFAPHIFRWMAFFIVYHRRDSTGMIYYREHCSPDDVDGSNNTAHSGEQKAVFFFSLKGKLERWGVKIRTKKLNAAFSKIQNNYGSIGKRQCDKAESMEK